MKRNDTVIKNKKMCCCCMCNFRAFDMAGVSACIASYSREIR